MDVAGALGWTAIFPFVVGVILFIGSMEAATNSSYSTRTRVIWRRLFWVSLPLIIISVLTWITAIWMGYAQGAVSGA